MVRRSTRVALMTGSGLAALSLAVAGCSSTQPAPEPTAPPVSPPAVSASPAAFVRQAADATTAAGSAKVTTTSKITTSNQSIGDITVTGQGVVDFANQQLQLDISARALGTDQKMTVLVTKGKSYLKMPMLGDKWIEAPVSELGVDVADPTSGLQQLKELADLKETGTEEVAGVPTTKYTGTIDIKKALAEAGVTEEQMKQFGDDLGKIGKDADVAVWVDDQGRIVRFDQSLTANTSQTGPLSVHTSTTLSDFGVPVDITPPPASEVTQMPSLPTPSGA